MINLVQVHKVNIMLNLIELKSNEEDVIFFIKYDDYFQVFVVNNRILQEDVMFKI